MSAHPKTSDEGIRLVTRKLLEEAGIEQLSMQAVAQAVGVRGPSLYKRFASRAELLGVVTEDALRELKLILDRAIRPGSPQQNVERMARAYRRFAKSNPQVYRLIFDEGPQSPDAQSLLDARRASAASLFAILSEAMGKEKAVLGARTLVAFLHGFVSMEIGGAFHFGGNINDAFEFGVATIVQALLPGAQ